MESALVTIDVAGLIYETYLNSEVAVPVGAGFRPPLADGFSRFLRQTRTPWELDEVVREPATESSEPYDSHPALNVRLSALHEAPHRPVPDPDPSAIELISDVPGLEGTLFQWMTGVDRLQPIDWDDAIQKVWLPFWEERCRDAREGFAGVTPASLPDQRWIREPLRQAPAGCRGDRSSGLALTVLLASRGWSIAGAPGDPVTATRDGTVIEVFTLVPRLAAGELTADWVAGALPRGRHR